MASENQTRLIVVLIGILLAVVIASVVVIMLLPSSPDVSTSPSTATLSEDSAEVPATTTEVHSEAGFDVRVLQTSGYLSLDKQAIVEGLLPVQPPLTTGKANPFL